jgi:hypothetical protein
MLPDIITLFLAGFAHVPYSLPLLLTLVDELLLESFAMTAYGIMIPSRIKQIQAFIALTQMILPLYFLSGALYSLSGLPGWWQPCTQWRDMGWPGRATGAVAGHRRGDGLCDACASNDDILPD